MLISTKQFLLVSLLILGFTNARAQVNLKVGYNGMYSRMPALNKLFSDYNAVQTDLNEKFGSLRFLHGIEIGMRYKVAKGTGIELTWVNHQSVNNKASGMDAGGSFFEEKWKLSSTEYSIGLENYYGNFGFGGTFGKRSYKYLYSIPNSKSKIEALNESVLTSRFYLIIHVQTGRSGFAIKPYYQMPWGEINIKDVETQLLGTTGDNIENYKAFGINLVFYNGRQ